VPILPEHVGFDSSLHAVAYVSTPTVPFTDRDLSDLLLAARRYNVRHDITGKLLVLEEDGQLVRFAQWIEGPRESIDACLRRILADDRHTDIDVRRRGSVEARRFPGWDMGVEAVPPGQFLTDVGVLAARSAA